MPHGKQVSFSEQEDEVLATEVAKHGHVLFDKHDTKGVTDEERHEMWAAITEEINNVGGHNRTVEAVKRKAQHLKPESKKKGHKKEKTGEGSHEAIPSSSNHRISSTNHSELAEGSVGESHLDHKKKGHGHQKINSGSLEAIPAISNYKIVSTIHSVLAADLQDGIDPGPSDPNTGSVQLATVGSSKSKSSTSPENLSIAAAKIELDEIQHELVESSLPLPAPITATEAPSPALRPQKESSYQEELLERQVVAIEKQTELIRERNEIERQRNVILSDLLEAVKKNK